MERLRAAHGSNSHNVLCREQASVMVSRLLEIGKQLKQGKQIQRISGGGAVCSKSYWNLPLLHGWNRGYSSAPLCVGSNAVGDRRSCLRQQIHVAIRHVNTVGQQSPAA